MTSTASNSKRRKGFTLLEIVMVLVIASLVMAGAVGMMVYSSDEHQLRKTSGEIELLAKRARTTAILKQMPYAVEFRQGVVRMMPLALAGRVEKRTAGGHKIGGETEVPAGVELRQISVPPEMAISVRRWNSEEWLGTGKDSIHVWRFDPTGLCEPLSVRMALDKSSKVDIYHPLTGAIRGTEIDIR